MVGFGFACPGRLLLYWDDDLYDIEHIVIDTQARDAVKEYRTERFRVRHLSSRPRRCAEIKPVSVGGHTDNTDQPFVTSAEIISLGVGGNGAHGQVGPDRRRDDT